MSRLLATAAVALVALAAPAAASASRTTNACLYDLNATWGDIPITIEGTPVQSGGKVVLTDTRVNAELPNWAASYMAVLGNGTHELQVTAWVALAGLGTAEGVQVKTLQGVATTTVSGSSATPFVFTAPPLENTTWTPLAQTVTFQQAGPKGLPDTVPAGRGGAPVATRGSVYISARKSLGSGLGELRFNIDCQPGTTPNGTVKNSDTFTAANPTPFAAFSLPAPPPGGTGGPTGGGTTSGGTTGGGTTGAGTGAATRDAAIRSTKLRSTSKSVKVSVGCPSGGPDCRGTVRVRTASRVKLGTRRKVFTVATGDYDVEAGDKKMVLLKLSKDGRSLRRRRAKLSVDVTLRPNTGAGAIDKSLRLYRAKAAKRGKKKS